LSRLFHEAGGSAGALASNITSAAFQLAIWEIEYDTDHNLATGVFQVATPASGDALTAYNQAQTWLSDLYAPGVVADYVVILLASNAIPQSQNFITDAHIPAHDLLPEPSSLPLLGLGLAAMIFVGRRRSTQGSQS
jgi:PEP-CTERM motif